MINYKIFGFLRVAVQAAILLTCLIWSTQLIDMFSDSTIFTLQFTNISAALFLALANVCFAWARSLNTSRHKLSFRRLNRISFGCIFAAVFFLSTSFSNYIIQSGVAKKIDIYHNPVYITMIGAKYLTLLIALALVGCIIWQLFREAGHLFLYEYSSLSDIGQQDCEDFAIPKRLNRYGKKTMVADWLRKNGFSEQKTSEGYPSYSKGNVQLNITEHFLLPLFEIKVAYFDGNKPSEESARTSNLNVLITFIGLIRTKHKGDPGDIPELQHIDDLLHGSADPKP